MDRGERERGACLVGRAPALRIQDKVDAPIDPKASSNSLQRQSLRVEDHRLARRVPFELHSLSVGPFGGKVDRNAEPVAARRIERSAPVPYSVPYGVPVGAPGRRPHSSNPALERLTWSTTAPVRVPSLRA